MSKPTKEYLQAKADLCEKVAIKQAERGDIGSALANFLRMQNALEIIRLEGDNEVAPVRLNLLSQEEEGGLWKQK